MQVSGAFCRRKTKENRSFHIIRISVLRFVDGAVRGFNSEYLISHLRIYM